MRHRKKTHLGPALTAVGAGILCASYFTGLSRFNGVLLTGLAIVAAGIIIYVRSIKKIGKY